MKRTIRQLSILSCALFSMTAFAQNKVQDRVKKVAADTTKVATATPPSGSNRNIMLSATSNSEAREINIGLPAKSGGVVIFENDLPLVIYQNAEYPARSWRNNASIAGAGLQSVEKVLSASNFTAYGVNSYTRLGTDATKVCGSMEGNTVGMFTSDINISGPLSKKSKLYYSVGAYYNNDPGSITKSGFGYFNDRTDLYNVGLTKRFKKGEVSLLYKYAYSANNTAAALFTYHSDGSVTPVSGFKIGSDSYFINTGRLRFLDPVSGQYYWANLAERDEIGSKINQVDLTGNYNFGKGWNVKYTFRYHTADVSDLRYNHTNLATATASDGFKDLYGNAYVGQVQGVTGAGINHVMLTNNAGRIELTKKHKSHLFGLTLLGQYYDEGKDGFHNNRTFFYQTVEAQPSLLFHPLASTTRFKKTDAYGFYNYNQGMPWHRGTEYRYTASINDIWDVNKKLRLSYGLSIRKETMDVDWSTQTRGGNFVFTPDYLVLNKKHNWTNLIGNIGSNYRITKYLGVKLDLNYFENCADLDSYQNTTEPTLNISKTKMATFQLYYNHPKFNLVSGITKLNKTNNNQRLNYTNPVDGAQANINQIYDTQTLGWTTDIIAKPFKNFNLHYLLTIQNPTYSNYHFSAFGNDYDYSDKVVLGISKVIQEIDPTFTTNDKKLRIWASIRTFSKQYANYSNVLFFKGWYETFCGANYQLNKTTNVGLTVTNPLNQRGAKGSIKGSEIITDPNPYYDTPMVASYIIPFNVKGTVKFNF